MNEVGESYAGYAYGAPYMGPGNPFSSNLYHRGGAQTTWNYLQGAYPWNEGTPYWYTSYDKRGYGYTWPEAVPPPPY